MSTSTRSVGGLALPRWRRWGERSGMRRFGMPRSGMPRSGEDRANRFILVLIGLQRLSYVLPPALSAGSDGHRSRALNAGLLLLTVGWNAVALRVAARRRWFPGWLVWTDVLWSCLLIALVTANTVAGEEYGSANWSSRTAQAAAALAGAALATRAAVGAVGLLVGVHAAATLVAARHEAGLVSELVSCVNGLLWFAVILGFGVRYLRRQGRLADQLTAERLAAEARGAADRARYADRVAHYRALHDTVLATLTAIARGGVDAQAQEVRRRCARDADYVRRLLQEDPGAAGGTLAERLGEVVAGAEALGLRVHYTRDALPVDVPAAVAEVLGGAVGEALNNVSRHAGVAEAWVTAVGEGDALLLRAVDRGRGFDPQRATGGFGLRRSVTEPVGAVGGTAVLRSAPGEGTCVELGWPR